MAKPAILIHKTRRANLLHVLATQYGGNQAELARAIERGAFS